MGSLPGLIGLSGLSQFRVERMWRVRLISDQNIYLYMQWFQSRLHKLQDVFYMGGNAFGFTRRMMLGPHVGRRPFLFELHMRQVPRKGVFFVPQSLFFVPKTMAECVPWS